jgi:hypothetical protein
MLDGGVLSVERKKTNNLQLIQGRSKEGLDKTLISEDKF